MKICGLQKTTLLDFPGHVAATIFLGGCNFRCPFCHNSELLGNDAKPLMLPEELFTFLKKRKTILEGVCITGGEPTLSGDLEEFIRDIRHMGYLVKLDTNGYKPDILKDLVRKKLLDYVAMDIKAGRENYSRVAGVPGIQIDNINESIRFLIHGEIPYEFRTTVVKELHTANDFIDIGQWISGANGYFLQSYTDSEEVLCPGFTACTKDELLEFAEIVKPFVGNVALRGIDY